MIYDVNSVLFKSFLSSKFSTDKRYKHFFLFLLSEPKRM
ncbi:unnamed protein product [Brassica napus]|uniref:(rape) hypothetical protein n=1 Tax=Brassica napus TaxID=3708 RepID=A0A816TZ22_BRANA|nr:unnamed protein product [Brassica napus]